MEMAKKRFFDIYTCFCKFYMVVLRYTNVASNALPVDIQSSLKAQHLCKKGEDAFASSLFYFLE